MTGDICSNSELITKAPSITCKSFKTEGGRGSSCLGNTIGNGDAEGQTLHFFIDLETKESLETALILEENWGKEDKVLEQQEQIGT